MAYYVITHEALLARGVFIYIYTVILNVVVFQDCTKDNLKPYDGSECLKLSDAGCCNSNNVCLLRRPHSSPSPLSVTVKQYCFEITEKENASSEIAKS